MLNIGEILSNLENVDSSKSVACATLFSVTILKYQRQFHFIKKCFFNSVSEIQKVKSLVR